MQRLSDPRRLAGPSRPRAALTLAETLIALGVLAVGLLGVAAVFPVGGFYAESGDIADRGGAIAQAALSDAVIRGHLDPENWVVHDVNALVIPTRLAGFEIDTSNEKRFINLLTGQTFQASVRRRMGLRDAILASNSPNANIALVVNAFTEGGTRPGLFRTGVFGGAFVIDPIGLEGALNDNTFGAQLVFDDNFQLSTPARNFPGFVNDEAFTNAQWGPWTLPRPTGVATPSRFWPIRRVTTVHSLVQLNSSPPGDPLNNFATLSPQAREFFSTTDDLAQFFPEAGDEPVRQRWENAVTGPTTIPSLRQSRGDYSWLISVAPDSAEAVDSLATSPSSTPVEVSAVVFHRRITTRGPQATVEAERLVRARVVSTSPGGGELLLERRAAGGATGLTEPDASPFTDLRPGEFVMVTGPHPQSTLDNPRLAVRWCRVLSVRDSGTVTVPTQQNNVEVDLQADDGPAADRNQPLGSDDLGRVLVAFRGPDWPWQATADLSNSSLLSNDLRVAILPGAVAVHTKTMRLESGSEWAID